MTLTITQKRELIRSADQGVDRIDIIISKLRAECPDAFHTDETLVDRRFCHQPATELSSQLA